MTEQDSAGTYQQRAWRYVKLSQYPLMLIMRWYGFWIILALLIDIPEPPLLSDALAYPRATVFLTGAIIFIIARDAARYHWQEHWTEDDECEYQSLEDMMEAHSAE